MMRSIDIRRRRGPRVSHRRAAAVNAAALLVADHHRELQ